VSIALYGYDGRLYVGIDADGTAMPDVETFAEDLEQAFEEVIWASRGKATTAESVPRVAAHMARSSR
jgi:hypothetical protein